MDIGAVDGEICRGGRTGACAQLVRELAAVEGRLRSTELIYCWDTTGRPIRAASRALTTATTSTGEWMREPVGRLGSPRWRGVFDDRVCIRTPELTLGVDGESVALSTAQRFSPVDWAHRLGGERTTRRAQRFGGVQMGRISSCPKLRVRWVLLALLALAVSGPAALASHRADVLPPKAHPYGHSYGEWAADWWQWALSQPAATNPLLDETGAQCGNEQEGKVWFLAGAITGDPVTRTCTVPSGKALLFPVINAFYCAEPDDPPEERTVAFAREQVAYVEAATDLAATIDGRAVRKLPAYFEESAVFSVVLPEDNIFGDPDLGGVRLEPCVDAGYYLVVRPLRPGEHTIHFAGTTGDFSVDVTYHLTVSRRHH
jgi:hypothetical protein